MTIHQTPLDGVQVVGSCPASDHRGVFFRAFCLSELQPILRGRHIVQINVSRTRLVGSVRGMHFQRPPHAESKFIRCLRGRVWDVAVDLRRGSPTFLAWHAETLSAGEANMMVIPEGCAHGFQVLEPESELLYLHTAAYEPASEGGVRCDDPRLGIGWPLKIVDLSARDASLPLLDSSFEGLDVG